MFSSRYSLLPYCLPIFYVLRSRPSASLSLLLSLSFNLSSLCHFAIHSPRATGSLLRILLSPNSISTLPPISLRCRTGRLITSYCSLCFYPSPFHSLFFHCVIALCVCVCVHMHMSWCICASLSLGLCVCCVQGPAPPCPQSLERLLSGCLAFRFKLNHEDESSLIFFFSLLNVPSTPPPQSTLFHFFVLQSFCIKEVENKTGRSREGGRSRVEERRGGGGLESENK